MKLQVGACRHEQQLRCDRRHLYPDNMHDQSIKDEGWSANAYLAVERGPVVAVQWCVELEPQRQVGVGQVVAPEADQVRTPSLDGIVGRLLSQWRNSIQNRNIQISELRLGVHFCSDET